MARKALLIGGCFILALGVGTAIAVPPLLEQRARAATDTLFDNLSRSKDYKVTRGDTRFDVWSRTIEIDNLTVEGKSATVPMKARANRLTVEGIGAVSLLLGQAFGAKAPADSVEALRQVSVSDMHIPELSIETDATPSSGATKTLYRDVSLKGLKDGIASSLSIGGFQSDISVASEDVPAMSFAGKSVAYEQLDVALYAEIYTPDTQRGNEMRTAYASMAADPFTLSMKGQAEDGKELRFEIGASSSGAARVRPSAFNITELQTLIDTLETAQKEGREPSDEDTVRLFRALGEMLMAVEVDHFKVGSIALRGDGEDSPAFSTGPITFHAPRAGTIELFEVRDMSGAKDGNSFKLARYGFEQIDYTGFVRHIGDAGKERVSDLFDLTFGEVMRVIPRGAIVMEGLEASTEDAAIKAGDYRLALTGPADGLPQQFVFSLDNFSVPVPQEDERSALLLDLGITQLNGKAGLSLSIDGGTKALSLDHMRVDLEKLAALNVTARTQPIDVDALNKAETSDDALLMLGEAKIEEAKISLQDRDGGIERLMASAASDKGLDADMLKQGLEMQVQLLAPVLLGDAADKVLPALSAFIKDPKAITLTGRPKDEPMSVLELMVAAQMDPASLPQLLDITAEAQ